MWIISTYRQTNHGKTITFATSFFQKHEPKVNKKAEQKAAADEKPPKQVNSVDHAIKENNIEEGMETEDTDGKKQEKGAGDAKMEVEEAGADKKVPAENGTVNGMDSETPPPELEKYNNGDDVEESQEDVWPVMAAEVDNEGFTPLLRACCVYRNFKVCTSLALLNACRNDV